MTKLGHYLREWRQYRGLTQTQLAKMIGIDRSYLSKIEAGEKDYLQYIVERIAIVLNCEVVDLIGVIPESPNRHLSVNEETAQFYYGNLNPVAMPEKRRQKKTSRPPSSQK